jgi:hypothetical protein
MAIHVTSINGMGSSTISGNNVINTGMGAEDHMHISEDFLGYPGVLKTGDCEVIPTTPATTSVLVRPGIAYIQNNSFSNFSLTHTKYWRLKNDANFSVSINANTSSNPRITSIFARVNPTVTPDANASNVATFVAVDGTPATNPVPPNPPNDGNSYLRLANITCNPSFTSITASNISNVVSLIGLNSINFANTGLINGRITATLSSNNLTVSIVRMDGENPTTTYPVYCFINGIKREINTATSITITGGSNVFNQNLLSTTANKTYNLFVHLIWDTNGNTVRLGLSRIVMGGIYSDYSTTTTSNRFIAISGGTPNSTDAVEVIARIQVTTNTVNNFTGVSTRILYGNITSSEVLSYTPTMTPLAPMTISNIVYNQAEYILNGNTCRIWLDIGFTLGGTATATIDIGLPARSKGEGGTTLVRNLNLTTNQPEMFLVQYNNSSTFQIYNFTTSNLFLGTLRRIFLTHEYVII